MVWMNGKVGGAGTTIRPSIWSQNWQPWDPALTGASGSTCLFIQRVTDDQKLSARVQGHGAAKRPREGGGRREQALLGPESLAVERQDVHGTRPRNVGGANKHLLGLLVDLEAGAESGLRCHRSFITVFF